MPGINVRSFCLACADYHHLNANGMPKGKNGVSNKRILCVRLATDVAIVVPGVSVTVKPRPTAGPTVLVMLDGQNAADTLLPDDGDGNGDGDSSMTIAIATGVLRVPYETKCGCGSVKRGEIPRDIAKWLGHVACNSKDATYGPFTVTIWGLQALIVATLNDPRDTSTATVRGPEPEPDLMIRIGQIPWSITEPAQYAMKYLYLFFELLVELCSHINSLDGARYNFVCVRWFGPLTRIEHGSGSSRGHMHRRNRPIRNAHRGGHIGGNSGFIIRACHDTCLKSLISPDGTHLHPCELFIHALTAAP